MTGRPDPLTGLPGRAALLALLDDVPNAVATRNTASVTLMVIDIDRFRAINASLGFDGGDSVLAAVADRLKALEQGLTDASLMRIGDDEFAVFVPALSQHNAAEVQEAVRGAFTQAIDVGGVPVFVSVSIGVAACSQQACSAALLADAQAALGRSKRDGRARTSTFDPSAEMPRRNLVALEGDLRAGLEAGWLSLRYQPIVRLRDMRLSGFEGLMRWSGPPGAGRTLQTFIWIAEETGLIHEVGRAAVSEATETLAAWQRDHAFETPPFLSINLSTREMADLDVVATLRHHLDAKDIQPSTLKLELTETEVMRDVHSASVVIRALRELGCDLALDDFGTGHSSLARLGDLPFDTLKIDKSLVTQMIGRPRVQAIVRHMVALAHDLGMDVVGEGAETEAGIDALRAVGCDHAQGFAVGRPLLRAEADDLVAGLARGERVKPASNAGGGAVP